MLEEEVAAIISVAVVKIVFLTARCRTMCRLRKPKLPVKPAAWILKT